MAPNPNVQSKKHIARLERERRQTRIIQYIAAGVVLAIILILAYGYIDITFLQGRQPVAEVAGDKITTNEFKARVTAQRGGLINQYNQYLQYQQFFGLDVSAQLQQIQSTLATPAQVGRNVLDTMIDEILIRQEADRRGITVSSEEVEEYIQSQFNFYPNGTPTPSATPTQIVFPTLSAEQLEFITETPVPTAGPTSTPLPTATLDPSIEPTATITPGPTPTPLPTATPYTLEGFETEYADSLSVYKEIGLTESQYRRLFETELLRQKLLDAVTSDTPREEEQVWARHILVADEEAAQAARERILNGEDFAAVAREVSEDSGTKDAGGDLGWFGSGDMVLEFEIVAFNLEVGEISEPIRTNFGYHIIQTLGKATVPLTASAYEQEKQAAFDEFLANLRSETEVQIYDYWTERVPTEPSLDSLLGQQIPQ